MAENVIRVEVKPDTSAVTALPPEPQPVKKPDDISDPQSARFRAADEFFKAKKAQVTPPAVPFTAFGVPATAAEKAQQGPTPTPAEARQNTALDEIFGKGPKAPQADKAPKPEEVFTKAFKAFGAEANKAPLRPGGAPVSAFGATYNPADEVVPLTKAGPTTAEKSAAAKEAAEKQKRMHDEALAAEKATRGAILKGGAAVGGAVLGAGQAAAGVAAGTATAGGLATGGLAAGGAAAGLVASVAGGPVGIAALAVAASLGVMALAVKGATDTFNALAERGKELKGYNANIALAGAKQDTASLMADIREANLLGNKYAQVIELQTSAEQELRTALMPIKDVLLKLAIGVGPKVIDALTITGFALERIITNTTNAAEVAGGLAKALPGAGTVQKALDALWAIAKGIKIANEIKNGAEVKTAMSEFLKLGDNPFKAGNPMPAARNVEDDRLNLPIFPQ